MTKPKQDDETALKPSIVGEERYFEDDPADKIDPNFMEKMCRRARRYLQKNKQTK